MEGHELEQRNGGDCDCECAICVIILYLGLVGIALFFLVEDTMEIGTIEYSYSYNNYNCDNSFVCGYKTITFDCKEEKCIHICNDIDTDFKDDLIFDRKEVNPSYNELIANIYYICTWISCVVSYLLLFVIWSLSPNSNATRCGIKQKYKLSILCCFSMIVSLIAVTLGIILIRNNRQNCSDGLYEYIESRIGESEWNEKYKWRNSSPQMKYGETLIFMMVTFGITLLFTIWYTRSIIGHSKTERDKLSILAEGIQERFSLLTSKGYGTATSAKMSVNLNNSEGFA